MKGVELTRKTFIVIGAVMLAGASVLFVLVGTGITDLPSYVTLGQSWVRTLASMAVLSCLLLAVCFWDK